MKKKIPFNFYYGYVFILTKFFLLLLIILPFFSLATSKTVSEKDKDLPQEKTSATVFVSDGTVVVGMENFHNAKIVHVLSTKKDSELRKKITLSEEIKLALVEKRAKENENKKLKEKSPKISNKVNFNFSSDPLCNSDFNQHSKNFFGALILPSNLLQKYAANSVEFSQFTKINILFKKQRFHASAFYLHCGKVRNSFLRGPPGLI